MTDKKAKIAGGIEITKCPVTYTRAERYVPCVSFYSTDPRRRVIIRKSTETFQHTLEISRRSFASIEIRPARFRFEYARHRALSLDLSLWGIGELPAAAARVRASPTRRRINGTLDDRKFRRRGLFDRKPVWFRPV